MRFRFHLLVAFMLLVSALFTAPARAAERPNIFFAIADDWGWPHAGAYGNDPVVKTPTFERIAKQGVLFNHAYVSSPSCTPSRNAILTGQFHWRLGGGANLWSTFDKAIPTYPLLLEEAGYHIGHYRKSWGPGRLKDQPHPAGPRVRNLAQFLDEKPANKPFCFWFGASDPHRPYKAGSGKESGMDLSKIKLFQAFPDSETVRSDVADYYWEVQRFDREVGEALAELENRGLLENTIVVITGDHGMPFPRCKSNLYDCGARVPLTISMPRVIKGGRTVDDFVSLTDLAPTFLELTGVDAPKQMTGHSLMNVLKADGSGRIDESRDYVLTGKERHVPSQEAPDSGGTPMRAIRTHDFLYIWNITPDRWPAGTPHADKAFIPGTWYGDCDNGPTKSYIIDHKDKDAAHRRAYELCFAKRPEHELYDLKKDPEQLNNVAGDPRYADAMAKLREQLLKDLKATKDPRVIGGGEKFDEYPYLGGGPKKPGWRKK